MSVDVVIRGRVLTMERRSVMTTKILNWLPVAFFCILNLLILPSVCPAQCVTPTNDLIMTNDTELCPGTYPINDTGADGVLLVGAPNIILDCAGAVLEGNGSGYAIYNQGFNGVRIRNCVISEYFAAIYLRQCAENGISENSCSDSRISTSTRLS